MSGEEDKTGGEVRVKFIGFMRRGEPMGILLSLEEWERIKGGRKSESKDKG